MKKSDRTYQKLSKKYTDEEIVEGFVFNGEHPAHYWWRLYSKELEHQIRTDLESKLEEAKKVKDAIQIRA